MKRQIPPLGDKRLWSRGDFVFAVKRTIRTIREKYPEKLALAKRFEELLNNENVPRGWKDGILYLASTMGRVIKNQRRQK